MLLSGSNGSSISASKCYAPLHHCVCTIILLKSEEVQVYIEEIQTHRYFELVN